MAINLHDCTYCIVLQLLQNYCLLLLINLHDCFMHTKKREFSTDISYNRPTCTVL